MRGVFFSLDRIMDVYRRKIVGWEVFDTEAAEQAAVVFHKAHRREGLARESRVLHSDNGSPLNGATLRATLTRRGVLPSFSRPAVSTDQPYSESLFKPLQDPPGFPDQPFESLHEARPWVAGFQQWYDNVHRHRALQFVTPGARHRQQESALLPRRKRLYEAAKAQHPERWSGPSRNWEAEKIVYLNPNKSTDKEGNLKDKAA